MARKKKDPTEGAAEGTTLEDYVLPQKVTAFSAYWKPCDDPRIATEKFGEIKLREFFKAYPCSLGDPLEIYLTMLENEGYHLRVDIGMNEPVLYVIERESGGLMKLDVV